MTQTVRERPDLVPSAHWVMWVLVVVIVVNVAAFASAVANPLIYSDNWTFVDTFLRVAIEDGAGVGDFLVKRAGLDHAQPLNKLLMLANYRWFGLDFGLESRFAIACAVAGWAVVFYVATRDRIRAGLALDAWPVALLLAAIAAVHLSLNTPDLYVYPLVTMAHAFYLLAFATLYSAWVALDRGRRWPLAIWMLAAGVVGDDSAILLGAAIIAAAVFYGWRSARRAQAVHVAVIVVIALLVCRGVYAAVGEIRGATNPDFNVSFGHRVFALAHQWSEAWKWVAVPLSSGVATMDALKVAFGPHWLAVRLVLAGGLLCAHVWFWRSALRTRIGPTWFIAIGTMLLFYADVAGILLGRVFVRGSGFMEQTRYVVFYQLGIVALLLMAIAALNGSVTRTQRRCFAAAAAALLLVQVPLSMNAWRFVDTYQNHYANMARDMGDMARDPLHPPPRCTVGVDVCVRPEAVRIKLMRMLVRNEVNLFSPKFRAAHPRLAAASGLSAESLEQLRTAPP
ncbi:MAG: hypothetical protein ABJA62_01755 [Luteimonas sp.]